MRDSRSSDEQHSNLYLLTGLVIGLILGVVYSWVISPVKYVDTDPASLAAASKDEYRRVIALAYSADRDLERASQRLSLIDSGNSVQALAAQAQRMLAENQPAQEARALAVLAADLGRPPSAAAASTASPQAVAEVTSLPTVVEGTSAPLSTQTPTLEIGAAVQTPTVPLPTQTPTASRTPLPTFTPRPTATPIRILDAPFTLKDRREVCDGSIQPGLLQIYVTGANDEPLPGVKVVVTWAEGENTFYTGLFPEIDPGYADFQTMPGVSYKIQIEGTSQTVKELSLRENCSLRLDFNQTHSLTH